MALLHYSFLFHLAVLSELCAVCHTYASGTVPVSITVICASTFTVGTVERPHGEFPVMFRDLVRRIFRLVSAALVLCFDM